MPNQSEHSDFTSALRDEFLRFLKSLQNVDGGWGFHSGEQSRVEQTSWAVRALHGSERGFKAIELRKAANFLQGKQLADGSWPAAAEMNTGTWVTSLTSAALAADEKSASNVTA